MAHSTKHPSGAKGRRRSGKPDFPLWLHKATGQWGKKILGRCYYFGKDRDTALTEYLRVRDDLQAGRAPQPPDEKRLTLMHLVNAFLTHKKHQVDTGELVLRTFTEYHATAERMLAHLGKTVHVDQIRPDDLLGYRRKFGEGRNATTVGNEVNRVRIILRFAFGNGMTDRPVAFGEFKLPKKHVMRKLRVQRGPRMFEAADLRQLLEAAGVQARAMILLAINAGLGNSDIAQLTFEHPDLDRGWLDYPRPKTGIERKCPLWPETVEALRAYIAHRVEPHDEQDKAVVFLTRCHRPWTCTGPRNPISAEFRKLLNSTGQWSKGRGFYSLRYTCQTIGDETGDYLAVMRIMGYADSSISDRYRERFSDDRLRRVADHVRTWLYALPGAGG